MSLYLILNILYFVLKKTMMKEKLHTYNRRIRIGFVLIFILLSLFDVSSLKAQKDTVFVPYGVQKSKLTQKDTVVKVKRPIKKPGTVIGNILHYLSPIKEEIVDSIYPLYNDDAPFYLNKSNHFTEDDEHRMDSSGYEGYWNSLYNIKVSSKKIKKDTVNQLKRVVYGYHPYWMGTAYKNYNFNLLSRIAYFSLPINPSTGQFTSTRYWDKTEIIELAHSYDCKVDLCISNFGQKNNQLFLLNDNAQKNLIANIIFQIKKRDADGVNINFEGIPKIHRDDFTAFIKELHTKMMKVNPSYKITITIPAIDWRNAYDVAKLKDYCNYFFLMGYDFYGKYSTAAGPNSLLFSGGDWTKNNIDNTINNYIKLGVDPKSLLLGLSYYGNEWETVDGNVPSEAVKFVKAQTYSYINSNYADKYTANYDSTSHSIYYIFREGNKWKQCWTDNELTLSIKYDYIKEKGLGGLGIWALGYDNQYSELWTLIKDKFTAPPDTSTDIHTLISRTLEYSVSKKSLENVSQTSPDYTKRFYEKISSFWQFIVLFFAVIMSFAVIGFIVAITDFDVRFVLFNREVRVYLFFILLALLVLMILRVLDILGNMDIVLTISILLGISAALIVLKVGNMKREKYGQEKP